MDIDACTLSASDRVTRAAEFSQSFTETVRRTERPEPTRLRAAAVAGGLAARTAEADMVAETECCSFFTFTLTAAAGSLVLDVTVPPAHTAALDALAGRTAGSAGLRPCEPVRHRGKPRPELRGPAGRPR